MRNCDWRKYDPTRLWQQFHRKGPVKAILLNGKPMAMFPSGLRFDLPTIKKWLVGLLMGLAVAELI